ncbi:molybdopterin oxidoreductase, partial [bacterium]|nr:molybdopterin oxidoreductase [bacterium]
MKEQDKKFWRSVEEREKGEKSLGRFNPFNNDFLSRREFMEWSSGMVAILGTSACTRMPEQTLVPYQKTPERMVPGQPLFFATATVVNGRALGVLAESHQGRPTKIEGNPAHPASLGTTDTFAQASVLSLYDPDRSQSLLIDNNPVFWGAMAARLAELVKAHSAKGGEGLRILTEPVTSPTLAAQLEELM